VETVLYARVVAVKDAMAHINNNRRKGNDLYISQTKLVREMQQHEQWRQLRQCEQQWATHLCPNPCVLGRGSG
jgi:hypothetical protein